MSEFVSTLIHVELRGARYLFFILNERGYQTILQRVLERAISQFGQDVGRNGRVIQIYSPSNDAAIRELIGKAWPETVIQRLRTEALPFLVIIKENFADFDPTAHPWRIIWLATARNPRNAIPRLFEALAYQISTNREVFGFLDRKRNPENGLSEFGQIEAPGDVWPALGHRGPGRPKILDPEWGIEQSIEACARVRGWTSIPDRQKSTIVEEVCATLADRDFPFRTKSVVDCLTREGIWDAINLRLA